MTEADDNGFRKTISNNDMNTTATNNEQHDNTRSPWRDFAPDCTEYRGPGIPYAKANNPAPGQWDGRILSPGRVAGYKPFVAVDGEGIRCSVYTAFCPFNCDKCFSPLVQKRNVGFPYDDEFENRVIKDLGHSYVQGLTLLGGEPMLNTPMFIKLCKRVRSEYGDTKDIWCWTGYTWEELHRAGETPDKLELLSYVDILVDGRFMIDFKDPMLQFRGSSNQRVIDVKKSNEAGKVIIWAGSHDQDKAYKEFTATERALSEGIES